MCIGLNYVKHALGQEADVIKDKYTFFNLLNYGSPHVTDIQAL